MVDDAIIHLSKPRQCTTRRVDPDVNYELQLIIMYPYWLIDVTDMPHYCKMLIIGESGQKGGPSLYFLLHFPVNPKLLEKYYRY